MRFGRLITLAASTLVAFSLVASGCSSSKQSGAPPIIQSRVSRPSTANSNPGPSSDSSAVAALEARPLRLPNLTPGESCPTSHGKVLALADATGPAILVGAVGVMIPQRGNISAGIVDLGQSDKAGWYGIKTHWLVKPAYGGPLVVRAKSLDGSGPISILPDAASGPLVLPSGPTPNMAGGWREQPSGTYVKQPGCYEVEFDGTSFSVSLVIKAITS